MFALKADPGKAGKDGSHLERKAVATQTCPANVKRRTMKRSASCDHGQRHEGCHEHCHELRSEEEGKGPSPTCLLQPV